MPRSLIIGAVLVACALPASGATRLRRAECRQACGDTIQQCVENGGRRLKCLRQTVRRCRREGLVVCAAPPSASGPYHVATTGADTTACGAADAPCRTIQFVIDQFVPLGGGGTIKVGVGTYDDLKECGDASAPNLTVVCALNRAITLVGGFTSSSWDTRAGDPSATVIDGQSLGRGIHVSRTDQNAPPVTLDVDGFTIQHGLAKGASSGAAIWTYAFGGGLYAEHTAVTLRDVVFRNNQAIGGDTSQAEGGSGAGGGFAMNNDFWSGPVAGATLQNVTFDGNEARGGSGLERGGYAVGGAMFTGLNALTGDTLVFKDNTATAGTTNGPGHVGTETGDALGGAVAVEKFGTAELRHVTATGNRATGGSAPNGQAGGAFGGALFAEGAFLTLSDAVIEQNLARGGDGQNGASAGSLAQGGGIHGINSGFTLDRIRLVGNEAHAGDGAVNGGGPVGGGMAVTFASGGEFDAPFTIRNAVIADNLVATGAGAFMGGGAGGLFIQASVGTLEFVTIADNHLGDDRLAGGGIAVVNASGWQAALTLRNSILANHTDASFAPTAYGDAALFVFENASATLDRVLFANNVHDSNAGVSGGYNPPAGSYLMTGILTAPHARFVAAGSPDDDYHLAPNSPAVDQATGAVPASDLDGTARPSGAAADLGAYELVQ